MSEEIKPLVSYCVEARHINHGWTQVASLPTEEAANAIANAKSGHWWTSAFNMRRVIRRETTSTILKEITL